MSGETWDKKWWGLDEIYTHMIGIEPANEGPRILITYGRDAEFKEDAEKLADALLGVLNGVPKPEGIPELIRAIRYYFFESGDTPCRVGFSGDDDVQEALRACGLDPNDHHAPGNE